MPGRQRARKVKRISSMLGEWSEANVAALFRVHWQSWSTWADAGQCLTPGKNGPPSFLFHSSFFCWWPTLWNCFLAVSPPPPPWGSCSLIFLLTCSLVSALVALLITLVETWLSVRCQAERWAFLLRMPPPVEQAALLGGVQSHYFTGEEVGA